LAWHTDARHELDFNRITFEEAECSFEAQTALRIVDDGRELKAAIGMHKRMGFDRVALELPAPVCG
jgi:hypothetical protein